MATTAVILRLRRRSRGTASIICSRPCRRRTPRSFRTRLTPHLEDAACVTLGGGAMATYAIPVQAYTPTARTLHWVTAALVLTIIAAGIAMSYVEGPAQDALFHIHRSLGVTLIPIVFYRLFYRLTHKPLPLPVDIEPMQRLVAEIVHWLLYALLVVQPVIGWIATSAYRAPVLFFW